MRTSCRLLTSALLIFASGVAASVASAQSARTPASSTSEPVTRLALAGTGTIAGLVLDERGQPLDGVVVAATGSSTAFAVSDSTGRFSLRALMPGPYLVRAHREGYLPARNTMVNVRPAGRAVSTFTMRREGTVGAPQVAAAGIGAGSTAAATTARDDSETAWRLRHLKRSILRDAGSLVETAAADERWFFTDSLQLIGRAVESSARVAGSLVARSLLQGQVHLLTTGTFDAPGELLNTERTRGVAYFSVGAPVGGHGDWTVRAALNHGDLSSWIVDGAYASRATSPHRYHFGMSYGVHSYEGGNAAAVAAMSESARNVGAVYGHDEWRVSRVLTVGYGAHYAHYDYLSTPAQFSPRLSVQLNPTDTLRVRAVAARHVAVAGAEEFLPPAQAQVLPPQRTFAPLTRDGFKPEDLRHYELAVERVFDGATVGVRAFSQSIDEQLVTLFGLRTGDSLAADVGHYAVGSAGDVDVRGWGVNLAHAWTPYVKGTVDYSMADAEWTSLRSADRGRLARTVPSTLRSPGERIHDLTTSVETDIPLSATRLYVLYKINSAFAKANTRSGLDGRWDVQVSQGLPFMRFTSADWEMLVAVRNLFRETLTETSVYDELLVVRPPKRLVGGITVKF